ncbi:MAG TPA: VOC family protein [Pedococcus sp.]|nr:VOC family protein [Pedococcus sp.]
MEPKTYPEGVPSWVDTEQRDLEAAKRFYGGLFGWTFAEATPPGTPLRYVVAQLGGQDVAGLSGPVDPDAPPDPGARSQGPAWSTYVAVDDADDAAARIEAAGGRVLQPASDAGEGGRWAVCADPAGVEFRVWQARRRPGAQAVNVPGSWNFSDLHTASPGEAASFYAAVFGWAFDDLGFAVMIRRPGYGDHLEATTDPEIRDRQAQFQAPPGFEDAIGWLAPVGAAEAPHWHVSFTVADRDEAAAAVERLGGVVLAREDTAWTRTALVQDPQGAQFTVSQFDPQQAR